MQNYHVNERDLPFVLPRGRAPSLDPARAYVYTQRVQLNIGEGRLTPGCEDDEGEAGTRFRKSGAVPQLYEE